MTSNSIRQCGCEGWWEQVYFGRRPMERLTLSFDAGRVSGSGVDIVGRFTFEGRIDEAGGVALIKQYVGGHSVDYLGLYDGEGTLSGHWRIGADRGAWMITIRRVHAGAEEEIAQIG
jgi:hypothetical protein